jgi:Fe-S-cluster containining protein
MNDPTPLCRHCALCCDGTLFSHGTVDARESERAGRVGLPLVAQLDGTTRFEQPCQMLAGHDCSIYQDRPQTCRDFLCDLGKAYQEDELTLSEARAVVQNVRGLVWRLGRLLPKPAPGVRERVQARALEAPRTDELMEALFALERELDLRFRGRR